jgi:membrane protein
VDNIPGRKLAKKAEQTGNEVEVPVAQNLGLVELLKRTFQEVQKDHLAAFAGNLTYKLFFALFPFFTLLLTLLGLFNATSLLDNLLGQAQAVLPSGAGNFVQGQLLAIAQNKAGGALGVGAVVSILLALWGVSGAFRSIMEAMNVMYEIEEERPIWKRYLISVLLSLGVAFLLLAALGLVVFGTDLAGAIAGATSLGSVFEWVWSIVQWPVLLFFVVLAFALIYYYAPDVEQRFKWISPGSVLAVVMWLVFSLAFSLYVDKAGSYNAIYGSLAGIIILLLYVYYSSFIMLVGAQINQVIEEHIPEGKNEGDKEMNAGEQPG